MAGSHHNRVQFPPAPRWVKRLMPALVERLNRAIDADVESAAAIYRQWNITRFVTERSFREYARGRRAAIREYKRRRMTYGSGTVAGDLEYLADRSSMLDGMGDAIEPPGGGI
jgi:hypothetical protein